jgi:site-specific recombinase XerD
MKIDDYKIYRAKCDKIKKQNNKILDDFGLWLRQKNLTEKTIRNHRLNIDFYINDFLLNDDAVEAKDGVDEVGLFLGYWFIKKAVWASSATIKQNAASIKKFYSFMFEKKLIDKESLDDLKDHIKENLSEWIAILERYDDNSIEDINEIWGF